MIASRSVRGKPPIPIPSFRLSITEFRSRYHARPELVAFGDAPPLEELIGWRLVFWPEPGNKLAFGGVNAKLVGFCDPIIEFFQLLNCHSAVAGNMDAAVYCDLIIFDEKTAEIKENYVFTFLPRDFVYRRGNNLPRIVI